MLGEHRQPRPLDMLRSIKVKLGAVVLLSVTGTVASILVSWHFGLLPRYLVVVGVVVSLTLIQLSAHGMVMPLREMAVAAKAMEAGDYSRRVTSTAQDEVGTLARAFNSMSAKLDRVEVERRELMANVSHELRTPIASLRARLENLADGVEELDPRAVESMLRATERLSGLVDQLLELSQFEAGAVRLEVATVPVRSLVDDVADEVRPVRADVPVDVQVPAGLVVHGDRARLHEVLANVLGNAVRHSPGQVPVVVCAALVDGLVEVVVADCGPGIPPADRERVFDRFHRVDTARSTQAGGAGLGLAIARSIVELHGGTIQAQPNDPQGCRMVIRLPA